MIMPRTPFALLMLLAGALILAVWSTTPPRAKGPTAPATAFAAERAMSTVRLVGNRPHPSGSPEAAATRAAIAARMRAIGLQVSTVRGVGAAYAPRGAEPSAQAGRTETLVGILPGRDRRLPAVAVMAHTDSVPGSPGAADDGIGVGVALETARALTAGPRPARDLMLVLTDGEEAGLLGAYAFFADPARAARVGAIVNVDARGTAGLGTMFETGPRSGGLVALYRATAGNRFAHSAATFLYNRLPNRTDLSATRGRDIPALNFAFLDGEFDYHTPRDRIASVDPRTLQSLGDQVLPVVRAVANSTTLPPRGEDGVFGDAAGIVALRYPAWVGWPLLAVGALATLWAVRGARARSALRAAATALWTGVAAALAATLGYALTGVGEDWAEHHRIMAHAGRYEAALGLLALACVLAGAALLRRGGDRRIVAATCVVAGVLAVLLGRPPLATGVVTVAAAVLALAVPAGPVRPLDLRAGLLGLGLLLATLLQVAAPPLTPLVLWPTLAAVLAAGGARRWPERAWIGALVAIVPLAYLLVFAHAVLLALGITMPAAIGPFALVGALLVLPLATGGARWVAGGAAVAAAGLLLAFRWTPATERHPALSQIYALRDEAGRSWRVSPLERPDPWTMAALRGTGAAVSRAAVPIVARKPVWRAPADPIAVEPPAIRVVRRGQVVSVTVAPANGGREIRMRLTTDRRLADPAVEGVAVPGFGTGPGLWRLRWQSPGEPVTLRFRAPPGTRLTITAAETSETLLPLPPRPPEVVAWLGSDRTVAIRRVTATP